MASDEGFRGRTESERLSYPVGRFRMGADSTDLERRGMVDRIRDFPAELEAALGELAPEALDLPYRPGGWTVRQVVHHLADSHANAYVRFRLALTEEHPTIRPYDQDAWSRLSDAAGAPVEPSLALLRGLHARWALLLEAQPRESFRRTLHHPEVGTMTLDQLLQNYAWHCRHHLAHIRGATGRGADGRGPGE